MLIRISITRLSILDLATSSSALFLLSIFLYVCGASSALLARRTCRTTVIPVPPVAVTTLPLSGRTIFRSIMSPLSFPVTELFL